MDKNKIYEYKFISEVVPNRQTLHSVVTHFFGKKESQDINFKIFKEGKLIKLISDFNVKGNFELELVTEKGKKFKCIFFDKKEKEIKFYKKNEIILLNGIIEYGINITNTKKKKCPFFLGRFEDVKLRNKFKEKIENDLGIYIPSIKNTYFNRLQSEILSKHIQFNNIIELYNLPSEVVDENKFNKIEFKSFFQKKSYGFGNLEAFVYE